MNERYCENCENFSMADKCEFCGMEFIEPEWSEGRANEMRERLSEQVNLQLT
jgi:rRNA maturation protein Nop10